MKAQKISPINWAELAMSLAFLAKGWNSLLVKSTAFSIELLINSMTTDKKQGKINSPHSKKSLVRQLARTIQKRAKMVICLNALSSAHAHLSPSLE